MFRSNHKPALRALAAMALVVMLGAVTAEAYSVLTHEQIVDLLWQDGIEPLLRKRFPQATPEDLRKAHAYAYGGSMVQDMGYYPFGNKFFSDLTHYVRSGDFVTGLIQDSSDLNEYAFALGALAHYVSDNTGHPTINHAVALEIPKLRRKFGESVSYQDDPKAHIRVEFGFDMVQVAKSRFTNDRYHDFVGFQVAKPLLEREFLKIYGVKLSDVIDDEDLAIGTFRRGVTKVVPEMTRVALLTRKRQMVQEDPSFNKKKFLYYLSRADYQKEWGKEYRQPGVGTRILAFFLKIIPKVGPFSALQFKIPSPQTEDMYLRSVDETVENYAKVLKESESRSFHLKNRDCDTGNETTLGEYSLSDSTYARLLDQLADHNFAGVSPELRADILAYFVGATTFQRPIKAAKNSGGETARQLEQLKQYSGVPAGTTKPDR